MRHLVGDRPVPGAPGHDEDVPGAQHHRVAALQLDTERPVPAQEQLVLLMVVPGELPLEPRDPAARERSGYGLRATAPLMPTCAAGSGIEPGSGRHSVTTTTPGGTRISPLNARSANTSASRNVTGMPPCW